jgi:hypothetical protein
MLLADDSSFGSAGLRARGAGSTPAVALLLTILVPTTFEAGALRLRSQTYTQPPSKSLEKNRLDLPRNTKNRDQRLNTVTTYTRTLRETTETESPNLNRKRKIIESGESETI